MNIFYLAFGIITGGIIGWLLSRQMLTSGFQEVRDQLSTTTASLHAMEQTVTGKSKEIEDLKEENKKIRDDFSLKQLELATIKADNRALSDKLDAQKKEVEELGKKFNTEFENIANKILETKSEKFTKLNKENLSAILEPLGKNIEDFKKTVNETYDKESKERFSLGERVKDLVKLNQQLSEEARSLTKALKGEAKTQGDWGEMILETILEKSGLRKGEEYFMQEQLLDEQGKPMRTDDEGKKMRPDAVIKYPDNRSVIIDSKVSLNAFTRYLAAEDPEEQKNELGKHVNAVKGRINELHAKGYDDYDKALDFVMMFIPSEPAYIAALQEDPDLWNYAYERRILLLNPTNLITSLKLIVDLWKREYQNRNAQQIADRGAKLYDKLVGFVTNLQDIGKHIDKAKEAYTESFNQLSAGDGNIIGQAVKLKKLGIKNKKNLPGDLEGIAEGRELSD
jgi:DNA recombination protein RmuC